MKIRIKFTKTGPIKFIGHLDIMRYFQKAFRRAGVDVEYSQGFSPHQLLSFAAPLGVGLTSDGEYMDAQLYSCDSPEVMLERLNAVMAEGIRVIGFQILPENSRNAMSIVAAADYLVSLKDGYEYMDKTAFRNAFTEFYNRDSIIISKKTKKSETDTDIRPLIYHIAFQEEDFYDGFGEDTGISNRRPTVAESYENDIKVYMRLAAGSVNNLKPELVMEAFCRYAGITFNAFAYQVHRMEVYADKGEDTVRRLAALDQMDTVKVYV